MGGYEHLLSRFDDAIPGTTTKHMRVTRAADTTQVINGTVSIDVSVLAGGTHAATQLLRDALLAAFNTSVAADNKVEWTLLRAGCECPELPHVAGCDVGEEVFYPPLADESGIGAAPSCCPVCLSSAEHEYQHASSLYILQHEQYQHDIACFHQDLLAHQDEVAAWQASFNAYLAAEQGFFSTQCTLPTT
ncbi:hypothetical protein PTSG_08859 [Salpingoeca rosetta]|uniref:Uncharacterized protein n=1 Tax=Salpingoeca rosetta (strain ATCC 50818 / BSB-021) TaxID=946362 RepID=F2UKX0_SALR5|nr:uncharacterized protein PTSG_08859 [Salpingoeca rosetta]EGD77769.1 hypothetical protein PTSG_08859 [Salpingoeca rosetta]|eukprot:XP_004990245.1 hypothetical protein PTSG_08859 [Salpingoeca rosetta]